MNWLYKFCNLNSDTPTEKNDHYLSIGHSPGDNVVLFFCNGGKVFKKYIDSLKKEQAHATWNEFTAMEYEAGEIVGRVDLKKQEGSISMQDVNYKNRVLIKRSIDKVISDFPGVKFWVFYESGKMSVQDFFDHYL